MSGAKEYRNAFITPYTNSAPMNIYNARRIAGQVSVRSILRPHARAMGYFSGRGVGRFMRYGQNAIRKIKRYPSAPSTGSLLRAVNLKSMCFFVTIKMGGGLF